MKMGKVPVTVRLFSRAEWVNGCLEWQGNKSHRGGYGMIWDGEKLTTVHKAAYIAAFGPVPDGLMVRHKCDNRICVRPLHLEAGTHAENMADMNERGRRARGERCAGTKLTAVDVLAMRAEREAGAKLKELAARYSVSVSRISEVCNGNSWRHV